MARSDAVVTIRDLARELGVSHATVSRALRAHPKISAATAARVRDAAERLGYVANASARTLRSAHSRLVGLVVPDIQNDFYARVARHLADDFALCGFQLALSVTDDDPQRELRDVRALLEARAAAVILTASPGLRRETAQLLQPIRTIQLVRRHRRLQSSDAVVIDDRRGIYRATRHLVEAGHVRVAYVGADARLSSGRDRLAGFERALREAQLSAERIALGPPRPEFACGVIDEWLHAGRLPGALVLGGSELTLGALRALHAAGVRVPRDVSLVGYGDPPWLALVGRGIDTVALPVAEAAAAAASMALADDGVAARSPDVAVRSSDVAAVARLVPTLVLRGSVARRAAGQVAA